MPERSKAEERLIRVFQKRGGKAFRIMRSAETTFRTYRRPTTPDPHPPHDGRGMSEEVGDDE